MKTLLLAVLLALGGCTQSDYFGDYYESRTVTYGMAGNRMQSDSSGYWHERGTTMPQGDVAIWNDDVNIHINSNPPGRLWRLPRQTLLHRTRGVPKRPPNDPPPALPQHAVLLNHAP